MECLTLPFSCCWGGWCCWPAGWNCDIFCHTYVCRQNHGYGAKAHNLKHGHAQFSELHTGHLCSSEKVSWFLLTVTKTVQWQNKSLTQLPQCFFFWKNNTHRSLQHAAENYPLAKKKDRKEVLTNGALLTAYISYSKHCGLVSCTKKDSLLSESQNVFL